jgi:hypothetical protein
MQPATPSQPGPPAQRQGGEAHPPEINVAAPPWVDKLLENQSKDLELKAKELDIQRQKDADNLDYAKLALGAQERDRKDARQCERGKQTDRYKLIGGLSVGLIMLVALAIWLGKEAMALEIIKAIAYMSAGVVGGYSAGRLRGGSDPTKESDD